MSGECEDCGADGVTLHCICGVPVRKIEEYKVTHELPAQRIKPGVIVAGATGSPSVRCCKCGLDHALWGRVDERGAVLGRHLAGRASWCPSCRYDVFVASDP